jgi:hypothetical protein
MTEGGDRCNKIFEAECKGKVLAGEFPLPNYDSKNSDSTCAILIAGPVKPGIS